MTLPVWTKGPDDDRSTGSVSHLEEAFDKAVKGYRYKDEREFVVHERRYADVIRELHELHVVFSGSSTFPALAEVVSTAKEIEEDLVSLFETREPFRTSPGCRSTRAPDPWYLLLFISEGSTP